MSLRVSVTIMFGAFSVLVFISNSLFFVANSFGVQFQISIEFVYYDIIFKISFDILLHLNYVYKELGLHFELSVCF